MIERANRMRLEWTRKLCVGEGMQIGYYYVFGAAATFGHFHLLMLGWRECEHYTKTLYDVDPEVWKSQWGYSAKISEPYSIEKLSAYMAKHIRRKNYDEIDVGFYNSKLLKKLKIPDYMSYL